MINLLDADETAIYRLKKSKTPIAFMVIFYPVWLYFAGIFLTSYCRYLFLGASDAKPEEYLIGALIGLIVFIPILIVIFLSYALNSLVISDRRVYIRKGLSGRTWIVDMDDIRSFQHAYSSGRRGKSNHRIIYYLYNGRLVKTGNLYITLGGLQTLLELLRGKFEGRGFSGRELKQLGEQNPGAGRPIIKKNMLVPILLLMPFFLVLLAVVGYLANK